MKRTSHSYFVGSPTGRRWKYITPAMRFEDGYIPEPNSGCWLWLGTGNQYGYGRLMIGRRMHLAHRIGYELHKGPIPDGLELDHLCRVRCCVNPDHLEPVTHQENVRRGGKTLNDACPSGHSFTQDNTWINPRNGWRQCRQCNRENYHRMKSRKEAA